jgi:hypothetical protein
LLSLGREPAEAEIARALAFIDRYSPPTTHEDQAADVPAWQALCRVLLSSNEFLYVE